MKIVFIQIITMNAQNAKMDTILIASIRVVESQQKNLKIVNIVINSVGIAMNAKMDII